MTGHPDERPGNTAYMVRGENTSLAWLAAADYLRCCGGKAVNLSVVVQQPLTENGVIRSILDAFVQERRRGQGVPLVTSVANSIFPRGLYFPRLRDRAAQHLYENHAFGQPIARLHHANSSGNYFDRLVAWPGRNGPVNQLDTLVRRMKAQLGTGRPLSSAYEFGVVTVDDIDAETASSPLVDGDLRVYAPGIDNRTRGFPCLSHVSLTLHNQRLHMTALYRNQAFLRRAYGNYLGLGALLDFLVREIGCETGELVCVATHADLEVGTGAGFGQGAVDELLARCHRALAPIDVEMRAPAGERIGL